MRFRIRLVNAARTVCRTVRTVLEMLTLRLEPLAKKGPKWPQTPIFRGLRGEKTPKNFPRPPSGPYGRIAPEGGGCTSDPSRAEGGESKREEGE